MTEQAELDTRRPSNLADTDLANTGPEDGGPKATDPMDTVPEDCGLEAAGPTVAIPEDGGPNDTGPAQHAAPEITERPTTPLDDARYLELEIRLRAFLDEFGGVAGSVHLVHREDLLLVAGVNLPEPLAAAVAVIPRGKGMAGTAWVRGEPVRTCDLKTDTAGGVVRPGARAVDAGAAVAFPVRGEDDEVIAVVGIAFDDERDIPEHEIHRLTAGATAILTQTAASPMGSR
jgi:L-methionine (R)-S-oxide reductase